MIKHCFCLLLLCISTSAQTGRRIWNRTFPDPSRPFQRKSSDWNQHLKLHGLLLSQYKRDLRPVLDERRTTNVNFQLHITHIEEVNEKQQTITLNGWVFMSWRDEKIHWDDKSEFDNITFTRLPQFYIWTPDLVLFNNGQAKDSNLFGWGNWAVVHRNGTVVYDPQTRFTATCHFDFARWPRDTQTCQLMFGSWIYRSKEVTFNPMSFTDAIGPVMFWGSYRKYGASWHIINSRTSNESVQFPDHLYGPNAKWNLVKIDLQLVRNAGYADLYVMMPLCVAWFLCLLSFWSLGKGRLGILLVNLLLQMAHVGVLVATAPPVVANKPKIFAAVELGMVLTSIACMITLMSDHLRKKPRTKPPPAWIAKLLGSYCCRQMFKWFLCLSPEDVVQEYSIQLVDGNDGTDSSVNQVEKRVNSADWLRVSRCFDFVCFVAYSIIFAISYVDTFGSWLT